MLDAMTHLMDCEDRITNDNISDLFFNRDLEHAKEVGEGGIDYTIPVMIDEARMMLQNLQGLGVIDLPSPEELVGDFFARM